MARFRTSLRPSRTRARRALGAVWLGLRLAVVLGVVALIVAWRGLGYIPLVVQTGSMEPKLPVGALLFVKAQDATSVRAGDVITFDPPGAPMRTTHRVVDAITHDGDVYFITKGDANPSNDDWRATQTDPPVTQDWQRGVSYSDGMAYTVRAHVPWVGYVTVLASTGWFRLLLIGAATLWLAVGAITWIWRAPATTDPARDASDTKEPGGDAAAA